MDAFELPGEVVIDVAQFILAVVIPKVVRIHMYMALALVEDLLVLLLVSSRSPQFQFRGGIPWWSRRAASRASKFSTSSITSSGASWSIDTFSGPIAAVAERLVAVGLGAGGTLALGLAPYPYRTGELCTVTSLHEADDPASSV